MPAAGEKYFFISSLAKGLRVLELLGEHGSLTVSQLARHLDTNRAGSHRFLSTLRELGYVEKDADDHYQLTYKVLELGMRVANRNEIYRVARVHMQELSLAFNETINLGLLDDQQILHVDKIDSKEILRMDSVIGSRAPAYCTALGKAILSFLPARELEDYLKSAKLKPHGPNTITSRKQLRMELEKIRALGYAVDDEELAPGLRCMGAPLFDHTGRVRYAISVSGPAMRMSAERLETIHPVLRDVCRRLSQSLGGCPAAVGQGVLPVTANHRP